MLLLAASLTALADTPSSVPVGDVASTVRARRGSVTLVNVWATWCGVCKAEFDTVDAVTEDLSPRGLRVVGLAIDDSQAPVERYLASKRTTWAQYRVSGASGPALARAIDDVGGSFPGVVPYHLLLGADGAVLEQWAGRLGEADLRRLLDAYLPAGGGGPRSAEVAALEQGTVRVVLAGRDGDAVYIDGWNAGVLPLETEIVGGLHTFRIEGEQGRVEAERNVEFTAGAATIDLGMTP